jgi:hypothetical protein
VDLRKGTWIMALAALVLGIATLAATLASAAKPNRTNKADESYLPCDLQVVVSQFPSTTYGSVEEAILLTVGEDVPLPVGFEGLITILEEDREGTLIGVDNLAIARVYNTHLGGFAVTEYRYCSGR